MKLDDIFRDSGRDGRIMPHGGCENGDAMSGYADLLEEVGHRADRSDRRAPPRPDPCGVPATPPPRHGHHAKRLH